MLIARLLSIEPLEVLGEQKTAIKQRTSSCLAFCMLKQLLVTDQLLANDAVEQLYTLLTVEHATKVYTLIQRVDK